MGGNRLNCTLEMRCKAHQFDETTMHLKIETNEALHPCLCAEQQCVTPIQSHLMFAHLPPSLLFLPVHLCSSLPILSPFSHLFPSLPILSLPFPSFAGGGHVWQWAASVRPLLQLHH